MGHTSEMRLEVDAVEPVAVPSTSVLLEVWVGHYQIGEYGSYGKHGLSMGHASEMRLEDDLVEPAAVPST